VTLDQLSDEEVEHLYSRGLVSDDEVERIALSRVSPQDLAIIDSLAYGVAKLLNTPIAQLAAEALAVRSARGLDAYNKVTEDASRGNLHEGERAMSAHAGWDHVGAEGHSYPEVASRAVRSIHRDNPSPAYGYLRYRRSDDPHSHQKIYLFTIDQARDWFGALGHGQEPYEYAAVFVATDLTRPAHGLESFGHTAVSGDTNVGQLWPFFLGLPFGALGGYFLRKWQEGHPGQAIPGVPPGKLPAPNIPGPPPPGALPPKTSGDYDYDYAVGGPWLDIEPVVGGPWVDVVGQDYGEGYLIGGPWVDIVGAQGASRAPRTWPQTKALIKSAIKEVTDASASMPAGAYVWSLEPASPSPDSRITLEGTTFVESFPSAAEALEYMRERIQAPHVALALFDRTSSHWPNPVNWTKSNDPAHEQTIAQQAAKYAPPRAAGDVVGAYPWHTTIGAAIDDVRARARSLATKRAGSVIGVIHTAKDNLWHALAFHDVDDADDWFGAATQEPGAFTYAAYFDKDDVLWPHPLNEKIGRPRRAGRRAA
jgi:hypothetical protein